MGSTGMRIPLLTPGSVRAPGPRSFQGDLLSNKPRGKIVSATKVNEMKSHRSPPFLVLLPPPHTPNHRPYDRGLATIKEWRPEEQTNRLENHHQSLPLPTSPITDPHGPRNISFASMLRSRRMVDNGARGDVWIGHGTRSSLPSRVSRLRWRLWFKRSCLIAIANICQNIYAWGL